MGIVPYEERGLRGTRGRGKPLPYRRTTTETHETVGTGRCGHRPLRGARTAGDEREGQAPPLQGNDDGGSIIRNAPPRAHSEQSHALCEEKEEGRSVYAVFAARRKRNEASFLPRPPRPQTEASLKGLAARRSAAGSVWKGRKAGNLGVLTFMAMRPIPGLPDAVRRPFWSPGCG